MLRHEELPGRQFVAVGVLPVQREGAGNWIEDYKRTIGPLPETLRRQY